MENNEYVVFIANGNVFEIDTNFIYFYANKNEKESLEKIALKNDYDIIIRKNNEQSLRKEVLE